MSQVTRFIDGPACDLSGMEVLGAIRSTDEVLVALGGPDWAECEPAVRVVNIAGPRGRVLNS